MDQAYSPLSLSLSNFARWPYLCWQSSQSAQLSSANERFSHPFSLPGPSSMSAATTSTNWRGCWFSVRAQELCESRGGRPGFAVPNSLYSLCGRKVTVEEDSLSADDVRVHQRVLCLLVHGCKPWGSLVYDVFLINNYPDLMNSV